MGLGGLGAGLVAVAVLLSRAIGVPMAAAVFAGVLLLGALILTLILRMRRKARLRRKVLLPAPDRPVAEPAVYATFLVGFLLARRFLGPR